MTRPYNQTSPAVILIREHHRQNGLEKWRDWEHVVKLCALMKISEVEICELYGVNRQRLEYFKKCGKITPELAIHVRILTGWWVEKNLGTKADPVVPIDLLPI